MFEILGAASFEAVGELMIKGGNVTGVGCSRPSINAIVR